MRISPRGGGARTRTLITKSNEFSLTKLPCLNLRYQVQTLKAVEFGSTRKVDR